MSEVLNLIAKCREQGLELAPGPEGKLRFRPPERMTEELRAALKQHRAEILAYLKQQMKHSPLTPEEREFLRLYAQALPWEESPGWEALQKWFKPLGMYLWLVRDRATGQQYAKVTNTPALVVSEAAARQWRTPQEARAALLPLLIMGGVQ